VPYRARLSNVGSTPVCATAAGHLTGDPGPGPAARF
jgi:hypothetical protein